MSNQKGFATLLVSAMLVLIVTLTVFIGARGSIIEQQSANNYYFTEVAFQNAEQGRQVFISNLQVYVTANPTTTLLAALTAAKASTNTSGVKYVVDYVIGSSGDYATLTSAGSGFSSTTRKVSQRISFVAGGPPAAALNALGNIDLGGSGTATSANAGGTITAKEGAISGTGTGGYSPYQVALYGHDGSVIGGRRMTTDELFMYYFGTLCPIAKEAYKTNLDAAGNCKAEAKSVLDGTHVPPIKDEALLEIAAKSYICNAPDCSTSTEDDKITAAYNSGKRVFWLSNGGIDHKVSMGTDADPVLIFVMNISDGSKAAKINATSTITGVMYVDVNYSTTSCSCKLTATVESVIDSPDYSQPTWNFSQTGTKCTNAAGCTQSFTDHGNTITKTVADNQKTFILSSVGYPPKTVTWYPSPVIELNVSSSPSICTTTACTDKATKCTPPTPASPIEEGKTTGTCSYVSDAVTVSGATDATVVIETLGTWAGGGTGTAQFVGAAITSGNYAGTGNVAFIQSSNAVVNKVFTTLAGATSASMTIQANSWSDMLQ